jgi:hypothetical protein
MITPRTMVEFTLAEPFRPFRLHMASGRTFEVRHPEMISIGRSALTVYASPETDQEGPERWQRVSYMLLESVEPLDSRIIAGN